MAKLHSRSQLREVEVADWAIENPNANGWKWVDTGRRRKGWFHGFYNAGNQEEFGPEMMVEFEDGSVQLVLGKRIKFVGTGDE